MTLDGLDLINIGISEHSKLIDFAKANDIAWTFIGPDDALAAGIVDDFNAAGLKAFGPTKVILNLSGLRILLRKSWSNMMFQQQIYGTFSDFEEAKAYIEEKGAPIVVKADGLALGKGVVVAETVEQAVEATHEMLLDNKFGDSGARVVIEELWTGKSSLSLPLSMGTSSTLCQRPKTTNVLMMVTRDLTLVGWVPMRQFLTCHRAWLTQRLTLLSSRFLKA